MFSAIYIENEIAEHALALRVMDRFPQALNLYIDRYGEIFNRAQQNFRQQKAHPSLILAKKYGNWVLPAPADYAIGGRHNYYFSHMMNCIYDCRYCFLQGMYRSAANVLFVNFDDMLSAIDDTLRQHAQEQVPATIVTVLPWIRSVDLLTRCYPTSNSIRTRYWSYAPRARRFGRCKNAPLSTTVWLPLRFRPQR